jgi:gas vesicle protein
MTVFLIGITIGVVIGSLTMASLVASAMINVTE